jgi:hypothetical protein
MSNINKNKKVRNKINTKSETIINKDINIIDTKKS